MSDNKLIIPKSFVQQTETRIAATYQRYYETIYVPWHEHLQNLKSLTNIIDTLTLFLPDKQLGEAINSLHVSTEGGIEKELSGTWYSLISLASTIGYNIQDEWPEISQATQDRLLGLRQLLYKGDGSLLREAAKTRPDLSGLTHPSFGRPTGITPLTDLLGKWGDELVSEGLSYQAAANRIIKYFDVLIDEPEPGSTEAAAIYELQRRPEHKTTGENLETRGDYLRGIVNRWRNKIKTKSVSKSF